MSRTTSFWCRGDNTRLWSRRREFDIILTSFPIDRKGPRYLQRMTSKNCAVTPLHERLSALIPTRSRRAEPLSLSHKLYPISARHVSTTTGANSSGSVSKSQLNRFVKWRWNLRAFSTSFLSTVAELFKFEKNTSRNKKRGTRGVNGANNFALILL